MADLTKGAKLKLDLAAGTPFVESDFDAAAAPKAKKSMFGSVKKEINKIKTPVM